MLWCHDWTRDSLERVRWSTAGTLLCQLWLWRLSCLALGSQPPRRAGQWIPQPLRFVAAKNPKQNRTPKPMCIWLCVCADNGFVCWHRLRIQLSGCLGRGWVGVNLKCVYLCCVVSSPGDKVLFLSAQCVILLVL